MNTPLEIPTTHGWGRSITYDLTRRNLFMGFMTVILRSRILQVFILAVVVCCEILLIVSGLGSRSLSNTIILATLYFVVACVAILLSQAAMSAALAFLPKERGVLGRHTLEITEQGLLERSEFNESLHKWPAICRILSLCGYLYIYVSYGVYYQVPKRSLSSQELAAFEVALRAHAAGQS